MLNLRKRELAEIEFRRDLPDYLADGEKCYIRFSARAGGAVNPAYMAGLENNLTAARAADRRVAKIEADEEHAKANYEAGKDAARRRLALLHDACIQSWETNILNGDTPLEATRENFLALAEVKGAPEISRAIMDFEAECLKSGELKAKADEKLAKN